MRILVLSDSHSALRHMRDAIERLRPDVLIHLGDYVHDGAAIAEEYPSLRCFQVAGNCDRYRVEPDFPEILVETLGGVRIYMTHGHLQGVKQFYGRLAADARRCRAQIALFGHTHEACCEELEDGLWLMNPGSCGYSGGSVGLIDIAPDNTFACRILRQSELEAAL